MELAIQGYSTPSQPVVNRFLTAAVTVAATGVIVTNPSTPALTRTEGHTVQLNNAWETLVADTQASFNELTSNFGIPHLLMQVAGNLQDYGQLITGMADVTIGFHGDGSAKTITSGLEGLAQGFDRMFISGDDEHDLPGLAGLVQDMSNDVQQGDFTSAFNELNLWLLHGLEDLGKPLMPVLTIPDRMLENYTNLVTNMFGPQDLWDFSKAIGKIELSPLISVGYELSTILTQASGAGGISSLADAPAELLNAFLNGTTTVGDETVQFSGLLNSGGLFDELLHVWPDQMADLLTAGTADLPVNATDAADTVASGAEALASGTGSEFADLLAGL